MSHISLFLRRYSLLTLVLLISFGLSAPAEAAVSSLVAASSSQKARSKKSKKSKKKASKKKRSSAKKRRAAAKKRRAQAKKRRARKRRALAKKKRRARLAKKRRKRRRKRRRSYFRGHGVAKSKLRKEPLPKPSGNIWLYAPNFREEVRVNIYDKNGEINEEALAELDTGFRCKRTDEVRAVDPRLYEILSIITDHFGGKRLELISGFRFQKNEGSRHYHASAMDIRVPGVSAHQLYKFAETLDRGGMGIGIYPRSGFVHIDIRAPGDPSYRWTDRSPRGSGTKGGSPSKRRRRVPGA